MNEQDFRQVNTPAYIFSEDELTKRFRMIRETLGEKIRLVYAVKANPFLIESLIPYADAFELCSPGEEHICRKLQVKAEQIVISGVRKEEAHIRECMALYGERAVFTVESAQQMELLNRAAADAGLRVRVLLRLSSGNQFGMDSDTLRRLIRERSSFDAVKILGIQYFSGTQKKERRILSEIDMLDEFILSLREEFGGEDEDGNHFLNELEFGPGLSVTYFENETPVDDRALLQKLREKLENMRSHPEITLEMGRYITAYCGYYLTKVCDLKGKPGECYAIVDGGIHQVNYYGQMMAMKLPHIRVLKGEGTEAAPDINVDSDETAPDTEASVYTLCGSLCTTADVLVREFSYPNLQIGDILVFERVGAYSVTEGISLFLSRDLPRIYMSGNGRLSMVRNQIFTEDFNYGRTVEHP